MSATPSYCVRLPSRSRVAATTVTIARKTASRRTISRVVLIGRTSALTPITKARVTTVDARALPSAMSGLPSSAAMPLTSNSGSAESVETNNAPTTNRLRPIRPAIRVALSVRNLAPWLRSEEHTSELQSPYDIVCRLLLEKTKITRSYVLRGTAPHLCAIRLLQYFELLDRVDVRFPTGGPEGTVAGIHLVQHPRDQRAPLA